MQAELFVLEHLPEADHRIEPFSKDNTTDDERGTMRFEMFGNVKDWGDQKRNKKHGSCIQA